MSHPCPVTDVKPELLDFFYRIFPLLLTQLDTQNLQVHLQALKEIRTYTSHSLPDVIIQSIIDSSYLEKLYLNTAKHSN